MFASPTYVMLDSSIDSKFVSIIGCSVVLLLEDDVASMDHNSFLDVDFLTTFECKCDATDVADFSRFA